jgi:hypothetical protein
LLDFLVFDSDPFLKEKIMSKEIARQEAIRLAIEQLQHIDLVSRCRALEIPPPEHGVLRLRAFGIAFLLHQSDFQLIIADTGEIAKVGDRILVLHYLLCDTPIVLTDEQISFRGLPGGQFYWQPFLSRTVHPLLARIGNDLNLLRTNLQRFDWEPLELGDFGARIHAIGPVAMILVYHQGDEEFPPQIDLLFDACIQHIFTTEDVAVLASRICLGLL